MGTIKNFVMITALAAGVETAAALPSLRMETVVPENQGAISEEELGPVFSRNLPPEETKPAAQPPAAAPAPGSQLEAKNEKKNDILSLFRDDQQPKPKEVNPLEEEAAREMKALNDPENQGGDQSVVQVGENGKQPEVDIKAQNAPKEIELDAANQDTKGLPGILK